MRIRDLEWLLDLAEVGNVTDCAGLLGVSQPTLSRALARAESELAVRLFERIPSGVQATPNGALALAAAAQIVERYDRMRDELRGRLDPDVGVVRLAFLDSMAASLVPQLLGAFHAQAPGIRFVLSQEPAHDIVADLGRGTVELGVTSVRPTGAFGWLPLQEERLVVIVPPTHRLAARRRIALGDLVGNELVTTPTGYGHREHVARMLGDAGVTLSISFESADLATIEGLVAAGLGVAIVPSQFAGLSGTRGLGFTHRDARRTIALTWRTDVELAPPAGRMLQFVRSWVATR